VLIMQGDQDQTVPYGQSWNCSGCCTRGECRSLLVPITGAGHVYDMTPLYPPCWGF